MIITAFQVTTTNGLIGTQVIRRISERFTVENGNNLEKYQFSPAIYDDTNEVLGTLDGLQQAACTNSRANHLLVGAPLLPTPMLRQLFKEAGVNVYSTKRWCLLILVYGENANDTQETPELTSKPCYQCTDQRNR